jgi:hypothetical protein
MTIQISTVANSQSFGTWLQRTNDLIYIVGANAVTADSTTTGSITTGNAYVNGIFGSNTLYVTTIKAGNIWSNGALVTVASNTFVNSYVTIGNSTVNTAYIGWVSGNNTIFDLYANNNTFVSIAYQNLSNGAAASADLILLNNAADNLNGYLDIGINSSNYSDPAFTVLDPGGSYLIAANNVLAIGTDGAKHVKFFANGTLANNEVMRITAGANVGIGNTNPNAKLQVTGTANISGNVVISGAVNLSNTLTIIGNTNLSNTITVNGAANFSNTANVVGAFGVANLSTLDSLIVTNGANVGGNFNVTGTSNVTILNSSNLINAANLVATIANTANVNVSNTIRIGVSNSSSNGMIANNTTMYLGNTSIYTSIGPNTSIFQNITTGNLNVISTIVGSFSPNGNIIPAGSNGLVQIGTSLNTFAHIYVNNVFSNSIASYSGDLNINSNTEISGTFGINGISETYTNTYSYSSNTIATVDSYSAATYRSAEYTVQATDAATGSYHFTKLLVTHDGSTGYVTEYGTINNSGNLLTFSVDINSGSVRLRGTPTSSNASLVMTVKYVRNAITV